MSENYSHETYLSPFTWRYGSEVMRRIWSVAYKRLLWRRIWVALAEAQHQAGLVTEQQVNDLRDNMERIDLDRAHEIEAEIHHDLMAEVRTYAEQCKVGGGIIHLGATSMDIEDNADALRLRESLSLILQSLRELLSVVADLIDEEAGQVCMAFTHLQPAEPTTIGYRIANYAQDLLADFEAINRICAGIRGKGLKGAVGTSASYYELLEGKGITPDELETHVLNSLDLSAFSITHQTYPRRQDWEVVTALSGLAMVLYRFAFDLRLLQSPPIGEWAEPFGTQQVGSSAMPFKRNPIHAENMDSLARFVAELPRIMWDNAAHSLLERTLDDSANRRVVLPEAFLATDELLRRALQILGDLWIDRETINRNLEKYGIFAATERVLMQGVRAGGDRQELHEVIRKHSLTAWGAIRRGEPNPLMNLLITDKIIVELLSEVELRTLLDATEYVGNAPERARKLAKRIRNIVESVGG